MAFSEVERKACLAHLFTYLDFEKGVLGLAYVGTSRDVAAGGICSGQYDQGYVGLYRDCYVFQLVEFCCSIGKSSLYFNTGLTTTKNWGSRILTLEADLVTTHELGHNFGAEHDTGEMPECIPGEVGLFCELLHFCVTYNMNLKTRWTVPHIGYSAVWFTIYFGLN